MNTMVLGIGEFGVSRTPGEQIKTYALGSCVAVIMLDPVTRTVGMAHVALPDSSIDRKKAKVRPAYFADRGVPALLNHMGEMGCRIRGGRMMVKLAGGARIMDNNNVFNIGKRNLLAIRKELWQYGLGPVAEDVGGVISRTVAVQVDTGRVILTSAEKGEWSL